MKKIFASLLFASTMVMVSAQTPLSASQIISAAQNDAAQSHRNVMVLFHASW